MEMPRIIARHGASRQVRFGNCPRRVLQLLRMLACGLMLGLPIVPAAQSQALANPPRHAIAMHGEPAFPSNFTHMPYTEPDAPKGGRLVYGVLGTFDSLNPMIVRGVTLQQIRGHVIESLMARGND